jgi:hypothetical protein
MSNIIDLTTKLVEKQNKDAQKSFLNKMDLTGAEKYALLVMLQRGKKDETN